MLSSDEKYEIVIFSLLLLSVIMSGCGPCIKIDPEVQNYYNAFMESAYKHGYKSNVNIDIELLNSGNDKTDGTCAIREGKITLNYFYWNKMSDAKKEVLVFHELGHCFLGREHIGTVKSGNPTYPTSIMYPYILLETEYSNHKEYYIKELFSKGQDCKKVEC